MSRRHRKETEPTAAAKACLVDGAAAFNGQGLAWQSLWWRRPWSQADAVARMEGRLLAKTQRVRVGGRLSPLALSPRALVR